MINLELEKDPDLFNLILRKVHLRDLYKFLADFFYAPQRYLKKERDEWKKIWDGLATLEIEETPYLEKIINALEFTTEEELLVEFTRLFIGSIEYVAPPYASFYLEGRLMGESSLKALEFYQRAGLTIKEDFNELPDYIAVEFEFMAYLISQEVINLSERNFAEADRYAQLQRDFLKNFLAPWMPHFCSKIKKGTLHKFYYSLAEFLESFINAQVLNE